MNLESLFEDTTEVVLEATDTKGAVQYLQNAFDKAGLTINVKGAGDTIKCSGSLNRTKFAFLIKLVNGKLTADFSGMNVDSMLSQPKLTIGKDFRGGVQKFLVNADNAIAEIRVAKTFLMRLTKVLERVTLVTQKNKVSEDVVSEETAIRLVVNGVYYNDKRHTVVLEDVDKVDQTVRFELLKSGKSTWKDMSINEFKKFLTDNNFKFDHKDPR